MKRLFSIVFFLLLASLSFAFDFRSSSWGDTKDAVIKMEGTNSEESVGDSGWNQGMTLLIYDQVQLLDRIAQAMYGFESNSLVTGRYVLGGMTGFLGSEVGGVFEQLFNALVQKYGPASYNVENPYWVTQRGFITLWKVKQPFGVTILLDYFEKDFFLSHVANRQQL